MDSKKTLLLAILDGWGCGKPTSANAIHEANTPNMDHWMATCPCTTLIAHNGQVGLPKGQMGNSEVGHLNIGAGRIVYQDYTRINQAITSGEFFTNATLSQTISDVADNGSQLHLLGLLSDGGVHSHIKHLVALVEMAAKKGLSKVFIHAFMDGRDTPPQSGSGYMNQLLLEFDRIGCGQVATVSGRYYAMDRDTRWNRVLFAWDALVKGKGEFADTPAQAMDNGYSRGETDEFIKPTVILDNNRPVTTIEDGDSIIFFNFRADRAREICRAFIETDFTGFPRPTRPALATLVTMTEYDSTFLLPAAFPPVSLTRILGEEVSTSGMKQLRIAETEKYAHVTYFFNGGREQSFPGEDRILIESPRDVATYDQKPEMSAPEVTEKLLAALKQQQATGEPYNLVVLNFANCDMVGHTGKMSAAMKACETVDSCLKTIVDYILSEKGTVLITADHGNADIMVNPDTGEPYTAHTLNPVPFIVIDNDLAQCKLREGAALKDIAPTILSLMKIPVPVEMEGENLISAE